MMTGAGFEFASMLLRAVALLRARALFLILFRLPALPVPIRDIWWWSQDLNLGLRLFRPALLLLSYSSESDPLPYSQTGFRSPRRAASQ